MPIAFAWKLLSDLMFYFKQKCIKPPRVRCLLCYLAVGDKATTDGSQLQSLHFLQGELTWVFVLGGVVVDMIGPFAEKIHAT